MNNKLEEKPYHGCLRLRKALFHNHVYFITCSTEEGIMLPANPLVSTIIKSALIKAQGHHHVPTSHIEVNGNHIHFIARIENPMDLPGFMERFKTESAHYLNKLLGRKKRTIWCAGYDSPCLLTPEDVMDKIVYLYTNPVKDGLIESVDEYPGVSSWQRYKSSKSYIKSSILTRDEIPKVEQNLGYRYFNKKKQILLSKKKVKVFQVDPDDWMKAFFDEDEIESKKKEINDEIFRMISQEEEDLARERAENKQTVMGAKKLINQGIVLDYIPNRSGRKMWCISSDKEKRKEFISWVKGLAREAREVYFEWCKGNTSLRMPAGMLAPRMPVVENLIFE